MTQIYTPAGGSSPAAQAISSLQQALSQITSMPSAELTAQAAGSALNQPGIEQQAEADLTQQSGIPQLQAGQQDLSKIFQMYLADHNLSQQFTNTNNNNPYQSPVLAEGMSGNGQIGGQANGAPNPYLNATPDQIVASTQPSGSFSTPSQNTNAMMMVPRSANDLLDIIQSAIGGQKDLVKNKMGDVSKNYQARQGVLQSLIDAATKREGSGKTQVVDINGKKVLIDLETGEIIKKYGDEGDSSYLSGKASEALDTINNIKDSIGWSNTGLVGKSLSGIAGLPAYDFASQVKSLKGNLRWTELASLRASGVTPGQLSNAEGEALESAVGSLDVGQSPEAFKKQLEKIETSLLKLGKPSSGANVTTTTTTKSKFKIIDIK